MISVLTELGQNKVEGAEDFFYVFNSFFFLFTNLLVTTLVLRLLPQCLTFDNHHLNLYIRTK